MVVVHRAYGYRFVIYTSDHEPAHVHVVGEGFGKINLIGGDGAPHLVSSVGIKRSDMRRLLDEVRDRKDEMIAAWENIHAPIR